MPISFTLEAGNSLVHSRATGIVSFEDALAHIKEKGTISAMGHPELFDARDVTLDFSMEELRSIAEEVRQAMAGIDPAPIAFVTNSGFVKGLAESYASLTVEQNPHFVVFCDLEEARTWLLKRHSHSKGPAVGLNHE